jgi:hypothetical protein
MTSARELLQQVRMRAWALYLSSKGDVSFSEAERRAAREIAAEQRRKPNPLSTQRTPASSGQGITVANARQHLIDLVTRVGERMRRSPVTRSDAPSNPPRVVPRPLTHAVSGTVERTPKAEPAPEPAPIGIYGGNAATAELIPDSEYHTSCHDLSTVNWRESIARNSRIAARRG